jgi:hypothetical protein
MLAESPMRPSTPKASAASLPPPLLRLLPGGTNQFPGGSNSRCGPPPFHGAPEYATAHPRTYQGSERQPANISAFLVGNPARLGRSHSGERICSLSPAFRQGSQCIDPSPTSRRNSRSSTGAPLSRIIATITPSEGEFGSVRICFPAIAD